MERIVREIDRKKPQKPKRLRVAAYGRVSSNKETMLHSMAAQVEYYSRLIQRHGDWIYCGVYSDEGITGTKAERPAFQRLMADCRAGKIDMVITKAVSRFARNTLTTLSAIRELKALGIDVYFEENDIHSISTKGELMLTFLASIAQEESLSASENQKWRIRKDFKKGRLVCLRFLFGYDIRKEDITINEDEAVIVREIFRRVIDGESLRAIAKDMDNRGIPRKMGGCWKEYDIRLMITNEKYKGDAMLQKTFVNNHIEKKRVVNIGQKKRFYVENSHPAIVDAETFEAAQETLKSISAKTVCSRERTKTVFTSKIICGNCGSHYVRGKSNGKRCWHCQVYNNCGKQACFSPRIPEEMLMAECAKALGLDHFSEEVFSAKVDRIIINSPNRLIFHFYSGKDIEREWQLPSRKNSWTSEMREKASIKQKERRRNSECRKES